MARGVLKLSKGLNINGEAEVFYQANITRTIRPRLQIGLFLDPTYFVDGGVQIPKKNKGNEALVSKLTSVSESINSFTSRINKIVDAYVNNGREQELNREYLTALYKLSASIPTESLSYELLMREAKAAMAKIEAEEQAKLAEQQEEQRRTTHDFFALTEAYLKADDHKNGSFSYDHIRSFKVLVRCVCRWVEFRKWSTSQADFFFDIDNITADDIRSLFDYIKNEHSLQKKHPKFFSKVIGKYPAALQGSKYQFKIEQRGDNTLIKLKRKLKAFFTWLHKRGITTNDPFKGIAIGTEKFSAPYYLSVEERNRIADYDLSAIPKLERQRDIFVFQCLIGCRVGDLLGLTEDLIDDKGFLRYVDHKTKDERNKKMVVVPLTEQALHLINKYRGVDTKGRLFPFISKQKYNEAIKEVLSRVGIERIVQVRNPLTGEMERVNIADKITSHIARKTFTAAAYREVKDPNIVCKMTGHIEGSKAFTRYNNIEDEVLASVVKSESFLGKIDTAKAEVIKMVESLNDEQLEKVKAYINTLL